MYWDLNIAHPGNKQQAKLIAALAIQLGYDGIVWTKTVTTKLTPKDANNMEVADVADTWKAFGSQQSVLRLKQADYQLGDATVASAAAAASPSTAAAASSSPVVPANTHSFQQKSRIHIVIEDVGQLHSLNVTNPTLASYDVVSVSSANEKLFHACCSHESVDIVVIEASRKLPFYLKKPAINLAVERGIHFEFNYAPSIRDAASRRYLFSNILSFLRLTRGRNLLLTSAAAKEMELRSPWDVINLAVLCGIDPCTAKASISAHARSVLLHAEARKTMKCVLKEVKLGGAADHPKPAQEDGKPTKRMKLNNK